MSGLRPAYGTITDVMGGGLRGAVGTSVASPA